ncbi:hypothetical protein NQU36_26715, partial [Escherichia coli]
MNNNNNNNNNNKNPHPPQKKSKKERKKKRKGRLSSFCKEHFPQNTSPVWTHKKPIEIIVQPARGTT